MTEIETHPLPDGFIPKETRALIVGTFPPKKYLQHKHLFFYPSAQNHFWNRMDNIFPTVELKKTKSKRRDISFEQNKIDKQQFAIQQQIGFLDIFTKVRRTRENTSRDIDLIPQENIIENEKIFKIIRTHPTLLRICCTYSLAYHTIKNSLDISFIRTQPNDWSANREVLLFSYENRTIEIYLLYPATRSGQKGVSS